MDEVSALPTVRIARRRGIAGRINSPEPPKVDDRWYARLAPPPVQPAAESWPPARPPRPIRLVLPPSSPSLPERRRSQPSPPGALIAGLPAALLDPPRPSIAAALVLAGALAAAILTLSPEHPTTASLLLVLPVAVVACLGGATIGALAGLGAACLALLWVAAGVLPGFLIATWPVLLCLPVAGAGIGAAVERERAVRRRLATLWQLAHCDPLTGLSNRACFLQHCRTALARADGTRATVAVLFIDLDGFKAVNDRHGHAAGDRLLELVAQRLRAALRAEDAIARFGGDEFAVLLEGIRQPAAAGRIADRVADRLSAPYEVGGLRLTLAASIGVALPDAGTVDADALIARADAAMYAVKQARPGPGAPPPTAYTTSGVGEGWSAPCPTDSGSGSSCWRWSPGRPSSTVSPSGACAISAAGPASAATTRCSGRW